MSKNFKFLQLFVCLNALVSQKERKTQQIFLPKSNLINHMNYQIGHSFFLIQLSKYSSRSMGKSETKSYHTHIYPV